MSERRKLSGGSAIAKILKEYGVEYVAGIPGHGCWMLTDALMEEGCEIPFIQVMHEQSAVHMADGYYRASGKPMAAITSLGPGAANTIIGLGTAYADSTAVLLFTGAPATHMEGHGVMQELDRGNASDFSSVTGGVTKKHYKINRVEQIPFVLHRAFNAMLTGRPGPVHIEVPMDIQAEEANVEVHKLENRIPTSKIRADEESIKKAVDILLESKRPVIVVGGGVITSEGTEELKQLAEAIGAAVVTTWNGKSGFPEDHKLFAGAVGQTGTTSGNKIAAEADVVLSVGCRFTDWSASSYSKGVSFSIPPAKLIHIDIDPSEIGKNYPVEVGIVADAKLALADMLSFIKEEDLERINSVRQEYFARIEELKKEWQEIIGPRCYSDSSPMTSQRPLIELRKVLPRDGIVVVGSGNTQGAVKQSFPVYEPRTFLTSGSYSSMGWAVPAAIGAKLAKPDKKVVCILGDGDFLQTLPEIGVAAMHNIPVVFLIQNNMGYMSIRGGQRKITSRHIGTEFNYKNGEPYSPHFAEVAKNFGLKAWRAETPGQLAQALQEALDTDGPTVVEAMTSRDAAGPLVTGWWDFPVPAYIEDERQDEYSQYREQEQHL